MTGIRRLINSSLMFTCSEREQEDSQRAATYFCDKVAFLHVVTHKHRRITCECTLMHEHACTHLSTMTVTDRTLQRAAAIAFNIS